MKMELSIRTLYKTFFGLILFHIYLFCWAQSQALHPINLNIEGTLEVRAALFLPAEKNMPESVQYLLHQDDGTFYYLRFVDTPRPNLETGARIRVLKGTYAGTIDNSYVILTTEKDIVVIKDSPTPLATTGPQKTIVFLVNFQNQPSNKPWTREQINSLMFSNVNGMLFEKSYRKTTLVGNVVGWYTLAIDSTSNCTTLPNEVRRLATEAAVKAGVDLSSYTRRIYFFPRTTSCRWAGLGTVGGSPSHSWINGYTQPYISAHELGHNFGIWHSNLLKCTGSPNQGNCTRIEYGDRADTMGNAGAGHFNAYQKELLAWLNYQNVSTIKTVTTSGTYTLDRYETANANTKALKVLKRTLSNGSKDYYYLEFRQPIGVDSRLGCLQCDFTKGVLIHQGNSQNKNSSELLDMTPNDNNSNRVALLPGSSFKDTNAPNGGVTFTVKSVSSTSAVVRITFGTSSVADTNKNANLVENTEELLPG